MSTSGGRSGIPWPTVTQQSGQAFEPLPGGTLTAASRSNLLLLFVPMLITGSVKVSALAAEVTTVGQTGALVRLGLYEDSGAGQPGNLLVDAGTIPGDAAGVAATTLVQPVTLTPGWYWTAAVVQAAATTQPALRCYSTFGTEPPLPGPYFPTGSYLTQTGYSYLFPGQSGVSGALPATATSIPNVSAAPRVLIEMA